MNYLDFISIFIWTIYVRVFIFFALLKSATDEYKSLSGVKRPADDVFPAAIDLEPATVHLTLWRRGLPGK